MEPRVSIVTLGVASLQRSREFYERLGWRRSMAQNEGIVFFQLALYPRDELAKDVNIASDGSGFTGITLAYPATTKKLTRFSDRLKQPEQSWSSLRRKPSGEVMPDIFRS